jgi:hypothetical protein
MTWWLTRMCHEAASKIGSGQTGRNQMDGRRSHSVDFNYWRYRPDERKSGLEIDRLIDLIKSHMVGCQRAKRI